MPAKSGSQYRLMQASCHGGSTKVPQATACEFVHATSPKKRKKWSKRPKYKFEQGGK